MTVNDPYYARMLDSLTYPNPPAGFAAILINVGATEPVIIHVDLHDGTPREFKFDSGEVSFKTDIEPVVTMASPLDSLQPKMPYLPNTPEGRVRANKTIMQYLIDNKKIQAIKEVRTQERMGLKEAKDLVDQICADGFITTTDPFKRPGS